MSTYYAIKAKTNLKDFRELIAKEGWGDVTTIEGSKVIQTKDGYIHYDVHTNYVTLKRYGKNDPTLILTALAGHYKSDPITEYEDEFGRLVDQG